MHNDGDTLEDYYKRTHLDQMRRKFLDGLKEGRENSPVEETSNQSYLGVIPREDHVSLSTESTLQVSTKDKEVILKFLLNELVDELYERVNSYGYQFKTVAVRIVRSDFSLETREMSYSIHQTNKESITSVIQALLDRFLFDDNAATIRKVGLKVSKLIRIEKNFSVKTKKLFDYF